MKVLNIKYYTDKNVEVEPDQGSYCIIQEFNFYEYTLAVIEAAKNGYELTGDKTSKFMSSYRVLLDKVIAKKEPSALEKKVEQQTEDYVEKKVGRPKKA